MVETEVPILIEQGKEKQQQIYSGSLHKDFGRYSLFPDKKADAQKPVEAVSKEQKAYSGSLHKDFGRYSLFPDKKSGTNIYNISEPAHEVPIQDPVAEPVLQEDQILAAEPPVAEPPVTEPPVLPINDQTHMEPEPSIVTEDEPASSAPLFSLEADGGMSDVGSISEDDIPDFIKSLGYPSLPDGEGRPDIIPEEKTALSIFSRKVLEKIQDITKSSTAKNLYRKVAIAAVLASALIISGKIAEKALDRPASEITQKAQAENNTVRLDLEYKKLVDSIEGPVSFERGQLIEDESFVKAGATLCYGDILFRLDRLKGETYEGGKPSSESVSKYENTAKLLLSAKKLWPQAVKYQITEQDGQLTLQPLDWQKNIEVIESKQADILVVGGELESITTAMAAADRGENVILLYSGSLGGLSSEEGGNLKYFDAMTSAPMTSVQKKIMHEALGMEEGNEWSLPDNVSGRLLEYLRSNYPQIKLIETKTLNSVHVGIEDDAIHSVTTEEGLKLDAKNVIDSDPELRVAEKSGLNATFESPNISYGLVFDVNGIQNSDLKKLVSKGELDPNHILSMANCNFEDIKNNAELVAKYHDLEKTFNTATEFPNKYTSYGYRSLGLAYDFYMNCLEIKERSGDEALSELNKDRTSWNKDWKIDDMNGFNISMREGGATFNSINYNFTDKTSIRQGDHNLRADRDSRIERIRDIEIPSLQAFLRNVTGNQNLSVRMPKELYVRRSAALYQTLNKENKDDFHHDGQSGLWARYKNDIRAALPRDGRDEMNNRVWETESDTPLPTWRIDPKKSFTEVKGLFVIGKSAGTNPDFNGALRIGQNAIGQGYELVRAIASGSIKHMGAEASNDREEGKDRVVWYDSFSNKGKTEQGKVIGRVPSGTNRIVRGADI